MTTPGTTATVDVLVVLAAMLGALLSAGGTLAYLRDMRAGQTVPHRGAWFVWTVIGVVATASHGAGGGRWSLAVLSAQTLGCLVVLGGAIRRGEGGLRVPDLVLLTVAGIGVAGWLTLSDPVAAGCGAALADAAGLAGIVPKIWRRPHSETHLTYSLAGVTGLLGAVSAVGAGSTEAAVLVFPVYYCVANTLVARLISMRRRAHDLHAVPAQLLVRTSKSRRSGSRIISR